MSKKTIYDMKLHDNIDLDCLPVEVLRVHGGWIYFFKSMTGCSTCFVPESEK